MDIKLLAHTPDSQTHLEYCARVCYNSMDKIHEGSDSKFLRNLLKRGHLAIFEHSSATFMVDGISRATSHQIVRHRLASFAQKSQRYVAEKNFAYVIPPTIEANYEAKARYDEVMLNLQTAYHDLIELGIRKEDARFMLPNATHTNISITANFREWLHIIDLRVSKHAQWEIREMCTQIWKSLYEIAPDVFGLDYYEHQSEEYDYKKTVFEERIK